MASTDTSNIHIFKGTVEDFKKFVADANNSLVVANFWAQWCAPCRRLAGMFPQMASDNSTVKFVKIDVDENPELAELYEITGIPNVRLFKGVDAKKNPIQVGEIQGLDNPQLRDAINTNK
ncbi:Thioredoxin family protein [Trichomonas vaginalis G3]|uniref:Thioredoxin family protein n=1 Tax=Trichomonas vaginalis (strain ATCC PRA-98 / G3) TaxID=412133 RepID=A2FTV0_TRIV3|nr:cell redox homeostasis [Trichomonas vaginalis G3]EAX91671.1 Thioredoxin family protein [Trichomonas vaginalis G3]KAI5487249.1 cell redox homeostasis [Trichomonas vaginalis G3]|eukprot:XP_001304601.1 Thioredoxin family protein [Trichomonas vaginalis G3]